MKRGPSTDCAVLCDAEDLKKRMAERCFLDEVVKMSFVCAGQVASRLQDGDFTPVGSNEVIKTGRLVACCVEC
jgi:hypothetical protein